MSKVDKNDIIHFKECCDKTYATSRNADVDGLVQQTVNGTNVYPKTKAEAVIMSDGKTLEETIQSGGAGSIVRVNNVTISGNTAITSLGTYQFGLSLNPTNYNVDVESVEVSSDCPEIVVSNITSAGFKLNVNSIPSATNHKLTIVVNDKVGVALTKEVPFTMRQSANTFSVSGSDSIDATTGSASANYTVTYGPTGFNVPVQSLQVASDNNNLTVSNVSVNGFKLTATATESYEATLTIKATTEVGVITQTKKISVLVLRKITSVTISGQTVFGNTGTAYYTLSYLPTNHNIPISNVEVTTTDSKLTINNATEDGFTLNVTGIPTSAAQTLTAKVTDTKGNVATGTLSISVGREPDTLNVFGSTEIDNETTNDYEFTFTPVSCNVQPSKVEVTSNQASVPVSNITKTGFRLIPACEDSLTATISVKLTFPTGKVLTGSINVTVNCGPDYAAIDEYGVAIMGLDNKFYPDYDSYRNAGAPGVNGIAVSDGTHRFCIAKDIINHICSTSSYADAEYWGSYSKNIDGATFCSNVSNARTDFNGETNTDIIVSKVTSSDKKFTVAPWSSAGLCRQFTFPNGAKGYLGGAGEWYLTFNKKIDVNTLMSAIGGVPLETNSNNYPLYWTSTQETGSHYYVYSFDMKDYGGVGRGSKEYVSYRVRAFCSF